jgi:hypothetical protein
MDSLDTDGPMLKGHLTPRFFPLSLGVAGLLLLIPEALSVPTMVFGLKSGDDVIALAPLATVRLDQIGTAPLITKLVIPDTPQWSRIRRVWGDPAFIISAVSLEKRFAYCLPDLGISVEVNGQGNRIPLEFSNPPYGYSSDCERSSLAFQAVSGSELNVTITKSGDRPIPSGELIIVSNWPNTKDKLVGVSLNEKLRPILMATSSLGFMLIVIAVWTLVRRRSLRNQGQ